MADVENEGRAIRRNSQAEILSLTPSVPVVGYAQLFPSRAVP